MFGVVVGMLQYDTVVNACGMVHVWYIRLTSNIAVMQLVNVLVMHMICMRNSSYCLKETNT